MFQAKEIALKRYQNALKGRTEKLVSGSDDFTMFLWEPSEKKQHVERMTGHQQLVNQVGRENLHRLATSQRFPGRLLTRHALFCVCIFRQVRQALGRIHGEVHHIASGTRSSGLPGRMVRR